METTYEVEWCEKKTTSTGKEKLDATLKDEKGAVTENATIWSDFPGFAEIMPGTKVTGTLTPAKDSRFGPTLYPVRPKTAPGGGYKAKVVSEAMERKEKSISHFQDEKEYSIKVSSTFRAAVDSAIAEYGVTSRLSATGPTLEQLFKKWREYYWMSFEVKSDEYPPFKN